MADPRIIVVGAGPAGVRAAECLVEAGLRPIVIDEASFSGGQIYRRQPRNFTRSYESLYGFDAAKARALHGAFDGLKDAVDYRPDTLAWNIAGNVLHTVSDGVARAIEFDAAILATGATDRLAPIKGWTLPGSYSLGGSQIALKAQACGIGARVVFMGTGPLLYLVAYQYAKAGVEVAAVLDTSPLSAQAKAMADLVVRPDFLARGLYFRAQLMARRVTVRNGITPIEVIGQSSVEGVRYRTADGREHRIECDAVAMGFHLRSETQLADLAGCPFVFDEATGQWRPEKDGDGRTGRPGIYVAGDGAKVLGADAAETAGRLAALAAMKDLGRSVEEAEMDRLRGKMRRFDRFRRGLATAFPWPAGLVRQVEDDVIVCRCEVITAGQIRETACAKGAPEMNRTKALSRVGMGRCQGRFCGSAAAEILAEVRGRDLSEVGRLRGQAPVKPLSVSTIVEKAE
ncbi:FAD/NAD(P)-binding oxidoreductase [Sphingomonas oleivorans]|uniref:FAD/NAD(P)-binding oxidoreductase n=1 Tax=Sphingomonas oleivorans TaxID=1735121 RepID=A0A2T5G0M9_9SPHN|nr:FAD/NAD(P)-binding oxidoreductase [Sphingomonas oleivorans]PTQ12693.1 FAD/NAD(P)-binding oxidoreductase [Sphingomonas oleivorans]